jgi:hypothetical protein
MVSIKYLECKAQVAKDLADIAAEDADIAADEAETAEYELETVLQEGLITTSSNIIKIAKDITAMRHRAAKEAILTAIRSSRAATIASWELAEARDAEKYTGIYEKIWWFHFEDDGNQRWWWTFHLKGKEIPSYWWAQIENNNPRKGLWEPFV